MEKENKADYGWLKSLLLSILGTFIGVGLTFYADRTVEKRQQKKAQRETAIMAVCDIDGRWELAGDSLKTVFDKESAKFLSFKLDLSHLPQSFQEREKNNLETTKEQIKAEILQTFKANNELDHVDDVSIDKSGNNMTLTHHMKGQEEPFTMLLTRKQK